MTTREDILERLAYARALSHGPRASALVAEAVTWADALGEEDLQVATRLALADGYYRGNEEWKALAPFVWNLARYQERPDLFDDTQALMLRWHFKWAVSVAAANPKVAKGQVRQLEASLEEFYRGEGASMHVVHGARAAVAGLLGLEEEAAEELAAWRATPRDENSDCEGCDPVRQVAFAYRTEDWELAVATAVPVLRGDVGCGAQPQEMQSWVLLALLASGRPRAAWEAHLRSYRVVRDDPDSLLLVGLHLEYLAMVGKVGRGMEILRRHLAWLDQAESAYVLLGSLRGMSLVLREAERAGYGEEPLGAAVPAETLWCPHPAMSAGTTTSQAYADLSAWARQLAAAFDRRNGNTTVSDQLERSLVRAPLASAGAHGPGGTSGAGGGTGDTGGAGGVGTSGTGMGEAGGLPGPVTPAGAPGAWGTSGLGGDVDLLETPEDLPEPVPTSLSAAEGADGHSVASALGIAPRGEEDAPAPAPTRGPGSTAPRGEEDVDRPGAAGRHLRRSAPGAGEEARGRAEDPPVHGARGDVSDGLPRTSGEQEGQEDLVGVGTPAEGGRRVRAGGASSQPAGASAEEHDAPFPLVDLVVPAPVRDAEDAVRRYADQRRVVGSSSLAYWHVADQVATRGLLPGGVAVTGLEPETGLLRAAALTCRGDMDEAITERLRARPLLEASRGPVGAHYVDLLNLDNEMTADSIAERDQDAERAQRLDRATGLVGQLAALVEEVVGPGVSGRHAAGVPAHRGGGGWQPGTARHARPSGGEDLTDFLVLAADALMAGASVLSDLGAKEEALQALEEAARAADAVPPQRHAERVEDILDMARAEVLVECGDVVEGCRLAEEVMRRHERISPVLAVRGRRTLGVASMRMEQFTEAVTQFREQTNIMMAAGITMYAISSMLSLGTALGAAERYLESAEVLESALSLAQRSGAQSLSLYLHRLLAQTSIALEEHGGVLEHSLAAAEAVEAQGRVEAAGQHLVHAALAAGSMGDNVQSSALFRRAASLEDSTTETGRLERSRLLRRAARALVDDYTPAMARSRLEEAMTVMQEAKELFQPLPDGHVYSAAWEMGDWHDDMAWILWRADENALAVDHCEAAASGYMATDDRDSAARALCMLVRLHAEREEKEEALAACTRIRGLLAHRRWRGHDALSFVEDMEGRLR